MTEAQVHQLAEQLLLDPTLLQLTAVIAGLWRDGCFLPGCVSNLSLAACPPPEEICVPLGVISG